MTTEVPASVSHEPERGRATRMIRALSLACLCVVAVYLAFHAFDPVRWNWGDPWSDGNVQSSGKYFAESGFIKTRFTPILDVGPLTNESLRYTHYPPLPDLVNGAIQKLSGPRDIAFFRFFALGFSALSLWFFFQIVKRLWGTLEAWVAVMLFASNALFIQYADTIHHVPLYTASGFASLWAGIRWLDGGSRRFLVACLGAAFLCLLASYDDYFFLPAMIGLATWMLRKQATRRTTILLWSGLGLAAFGAVGVKLGTGAWAVGKTALLADLKFQFFERATTRHSEDFKDGFFPILWGRIWRFFGPVFYLAVASAAFGALSQLHKVAKGAQPADATTDDPHATPPASPLAVLGAGAILLFVFGQLFCGQYHPTLSLLPFFSIGTACLIGFALRYRGRKAIWFSGGLLSLTLVWQVVELVRFERVFFAREDVVAIRKILDARDKRTFVLTNAYADGPIRYYLDRHILNIPNDRVVVQMNDLFDKYGSDCPITILEFRDLSHAGYDKLLYPMFAGERQWGWLARPFEHRAEWRERLNAIEYSTAEHLAGLGEVVYESPGVRMRLVTPYDLAMKQQAALPDEDTHSINFETRQASRFELRGFGSPEQYQNDEGFAWLRQRQPSHLQFTLQGLKDVTDAEPIRTSDLRVRIGAIRNHTLRVRVYSINPGARLSLRVNAGQASSQDAFCVEGDRELVFPIDMNSLHADGLQLLSFGFNSVDHYGNGVLFRSLSID